MSTGKVIKYDRARGFGFIAPDSGTEDIFVHARDIGDGEDAMALGSRVEFSLVAGDRGPRAADVRVVGAGPAVNGAEQRRPLASDAGQDDGLEVLSVSDYQREITDVLLAIAPTITAGQIVEIRDRLTGPARIRGWIE